MNTEFSFDQPSLLFSHLMPRFSEQDKSSTLRTFMVDYLVFFVELRFHLYITTGTKRHLGCHQTITYHSTGIIQRYNIYPKKILKTT